MVTDLGPGLEGEGSGPGEELLEGDPCLHPSEWCTDGTSVRSRSGSMRRACDEMHKESYTKAENRLRDAG